MVHLFQFIALCLLLLVTGVFWGLWFALSRSYHLFTIDELAHIGRIIIKNLAVPMRLISLFCVVFLVACCCFFPHRESVQFYFTIASVVSILGAFAVTLAIEVPINKKITGWNASTAPDGWEQIRDRWQYFNLIRVAAALASFGFFAAAIL